jgi:DNA-binding transcriptional ArsR family regulator
MTSVAPTVLMRWLRAAGEASRLRLLILCSGSALSVCDLAQALQQSEPRVSRHLKILCEAGLIERLRQGQWVHYRLAANPEATSFVRGLLAQVDRRDGQLQRDASAAQAVATPAAAAGMHGAESRLGRAMAGFISAEGAPLDCVLVVGVSHPELLESAARAARRCIALAPSRRATQGARAYAQRRGFSCEILKSSTAAAPSAADLARAGANFDGVVLDHPQASGEALLRVLQETRQVVTAGGRVWLFEPYESKDASRGKVVEHPLARLRRLLGSAGLTCERLSPVEADGEHVLAALARPRAAHGAEALP